MAFQPTFMKFPRTTRIVYTVKFLTLKRFNTVNHCDENVTIHLDNKTNKNTPSVTKSQTIQPMSAMIVVIASLLRKGTPSAK